MWTFNAYRIQEAAYWSVELKKNQVRKTCLLKQAFAKPLMSSLITKFI